MVKGEYLVVFHLQDYWKYVEGGRPKTMSGGSGELRRKILEWLEVKRILPTPMKNGKLPTPKQLAYLISRKIHKEGYKGTQDLSKATDTIWERYREEIYDAIDKETSILLSSIYSNSNP